MKKIKPAIEERIAFAKLNLMSIQQEQDLLQAIRSGDRTAIAPLIDSYEYVILKIVKALTLEMDDLDELVLFVKRALKRLAEQELNSMEPEAFTKNSYWWIIGASREFSNLGSHPPGQAND